MIVDIIVAAVLLISGVLALFRGFVKETLTVAGWIGAAIITLYSYPYLQPVLAEFTDSSVIIDIGSAATVFLVSLVVLTIVTHIVANRVKGSVLGHLDSALGFVFGLVRGALLVSVLYIFASLAMDEDNFPEFITEAKSLPLVQAGASLLASLAPEGTLPGRTDVTDGVNEAVDKVIDGAVESIDKKALEEIIEGVDTEERLNKLNQPEPESTPENDTGQLDAQSKSEPGYTDKEQKDMQRLIEGSQ